MVRLGKYVFRKGQGYSEADLSPFRRKKRYAKTISGGGGRRRSKDKKDMSTVEQPTPSASELYGSASQREKQIEIFRREGRGAFERHVAQLKERDRQAKTLKEKQEYQKKLIAARIGRKGFKH